MGLRRLDPELRATVVLRFYADISMPQVALAMAVPEGTVKSRLHRAVSELRASCPRESLSDDDVRITRALPGA